MVKRVKRDWGYDVHVWEGKFQFTFREMEGGKIVRVGLVNLNGERGDCALDVPPADRKRAQRLAEAEFSAIARERELVAAEEELRRRPLQQLLLPFAPTPVYPCADFQG